MSQTRAKIEARFAKDLGKTVNDLRKSSRKCDALKEKDGKHKKGLETLRDVPMANKKKLGGLKAQVDSDVKPMAHLATLVKDDRSNSFCVTADSGKLLRRMNAMEGKTLEEQLFAKTFRQRSILLLINGMHWWQIAKNSLERQRMLDLAEEGRFPGARMKELEKTSWTKSLRSWAKHRTTEM